MLLETLPTVQALSAAQKHRLIEELWNDLERQAEAEPADPELVAILEKRWEEHLANPSQAVAAEEMWSRIRARRGTCE